MLLQFHHAHAHLHARLETEKIHRLGNVVVRSGFETGDRVLGGRPAGQKDDVGVILAIERPHLAAKIQAVMTRHRPVEQSQVRRLGKDHVPCPVSVGGGLNLISPVDQNAF